MKLIIPCTFVQIKEKACWLIIGFLFFQLSLYAQTSYSDVAVDSTVTCKAHALKLRQVAVPGAFVVTSAMAVNNGWLQQRRYEVQDFLAAPKSRRTKWDNYAQYAPMLSVYALNVFGVKGKHSVKDETILLAMSYAYMGIFVNSMKYTFREPRPGNGSHNSFPSGHTATAFMGAEFLFQEYKDVSPWIGYSGYALAATIGYMRMYNNRHYINDVAAGAALGILSTKLAYWTYPKLFKKRSCGRSSVVGMPVVSTDYAGVSVNWSL